MFLKISSSMASFGGIGPIRKSVRHRAHKPLSGDGSSLAVVRTIVVKAGWHPFQRFESKQPRAPARKRNASYVFHKNLLTIMLTTRNIWCQ